MSTAFFPKNPNNVIKSRSDARSFMGVCPLMKSTVQLVPLRYGLVDNPMLDPSAEVTMPFALSARPLGIRLLRDGWLYVIEGSSGLLSEYRVEDGLVSAMLWQGQAVMEDEREAPIHLPSLIFAKSSTVHVAYAEVQWTAKKCHQVLDDPGERDHFMQAVDLSAVDCETGAPHLLTYDMAEHWPSGSRPGCTRPPWTSRQKALAGEWMTRCPSMSASPMCGNAPSVLNRCR